MQVPENNFNAMSLFPTLLQLAEKRRAEQEAMTGWRGAIRNFSELPQEQIAALDGLGPTHGPAILNNMLSQNAARQKQKQAEQEQALNTESQNLVADIDQAMVANQQTPIAPNLAGAEEEAAFMGQAPMAPQKRTDALRAEIDSRVGNMAQLKRQAIMRNPDAFKGMLSPEQFGGVLGYGKEAKSPFDQMIEQGKGIASLYTEQRGDDGKVYSISKIPDVTDRIGLPRVMESETISGLTKKSETEKKADLRYNFLTKLRTGEYDPQGFEQAIAASNRGQEEEILIRTTAQKLIDTEQENLNPGLVDQYKKMVAEDMRKGRTRHVVVQADSLGRQKARIVEVDDKGNEKIIYSDTGEGGLVTASMRNEAGKELGPLADAMMNLQNQKALLTPSTVGLSGFVSRYGGKFKAWASPNYKPTSQEIDSLKKAMLSDQYGLRQAKYESGAQRSDQEIARIIQAYNTGAYNYWEAKAALEIVEEGQNAAWDRTFKLVNEGKLPSKPENKEFGSGVGKGTTGAGSSSKYKILKVEDK